MNETSGYVTGMPRLILRFEGLALLAAAVWAYWLTAASWWLFALLFLAPDVSFVGYLAGPRIGAAVYNAAHSTIGPILLAGASLLGWPALLPLAIIWAGHVGFDRALGYGLKYPDAFGSTHLGWIGKAKG